MNGIRLVRTLAATVVAAIAAWSSYWHMVHVALRYGERCEVAYVLPLSVDGVLTIAAIVMAEDRKAHHPVRPIAKAAFVTALTASIAANVAAAQPTPGGRLIAAWPAIALLLIVEMLAFTRTGEPQPPEPKAAPADSGRQHPATSRRTSPAHARAEHPPEPHHKNHPEHHPKFHPDPHTTFRKEQPRTDETTRTGTPPRRRSADTTRQLAADLIAAEPDLTRDQVAARIGISTRRLRAVLAPPSSAKG